MSNYIEHTASGKTGTFAAKYDQHAERNGQTFTVLGAVDPKTYDAAECGELYSIRFTDGLQIEAWPEEVESAMKMSNYIEQPINATIQAGVLTLPNGQSIDLTKVQAALNFGFQETGDHDLMEACDEMSKLSGFVQGPSGEFVPAGDQQNAAMPRTGPDLTGVDAYALQRELERRGLLVQLWSPEDFEFIGNEDEEAADLSGDTLEQIQHQAFEQCRRSLDEITAQRGNEHLGDWWAMNKQPILEQFKPKDEYPRPGM